MPHSDGSSVEEKLKERGWKLVRRGKHAVHERIVIKRETQKFTCSKTPSDHRSDPNALARLSKLDEGVIEVPSQHDIHLSCATYDISPGRLKGEELEDVSTAAKREMKILLQDNKRKAKQIDGQKLDAKKSNEAVEAISEREQQQRARAEDLEQRLRQSEVKGEESRLHLDIIAQELRMRKMAEARELALEQIRELELAEMKIM